MILEPIKLQLVLAPMPQHPRHAAAILQTIEPPIELGHCTFGIAPGARIAFDLPPAVAAELQRRAES